MLLCSKFPHGHSHRRVHGAGFPGNPPAGSRDWCLEKVCRESAALIGFPTLKLWERHSTTGAPGSQEPGLWGWARTAVVWHLKDQPLQCVLLSVLHPGRQFPQHCKLKEEGGIAVLFVWEVSVPLLWPRIGSPSPLVSSQWFLMLRSLAPNLGEKTLKVVVIGDSRV